MFSLRRIDWVRKPLCEPNFLCIFVLRIISGPRVKFVRWKAFKPPGSVYYRPFKGGGPDVVPILYSSVVYTTRRFMFGLALSLSMCCFSVLLAFWSPCLGKRELVFVFIVHLFVSYAHVNLCHYFSSSWGLGLTAASVALPGLFYLPFCTWNLSFSTKTLCHWAIG